MVFEYAGNKSIDSFSDARADGDTVVVYRITGAIDEQLRAKFPHIELRFEDAPYSLQDLRKACDEVDRLHRRYAPELARLSPCESQRGGRGIEVHTTDVPQTKMTLEQGDIFVPVKVSPMHVVPAALRR